MTTTLEQLFVRFQTKRDPMALAAVYDRTASELYRIALHLTGSPADAEELLQTTFLAVIDAAPRYSGVRPLMPWLVGILRRQAGLMRRRAARKPALERLPRPAADDPADAAARIEFDEAIDRAIGGLPRTLQPVLVLRLKHGFAPGEIAHALRRPPSTVRTQLSRGLERLRGLLPAGLGLAALGLLGRRGLSAVRRHVLAAAAHAPAAWTAVAGATVNKVLAACGALAVAAMATMPLLWSDAPAPGEDAPGPTSASAVAFDRGGASRIRAEASRVVQPRQTAAPQPTGEASVTVVDEDGAPLAGVPVLAREPLRRGQVAFSRSDRHGALSLRLPHGVFEVVANDARRARPAFGEARRLVRAPLAAPLRLVLVERTGMLRVDVADDLMQPASGVRVSIHRVLENGTTRRPVEHGVPPPPELPGCLREGAGAPAAELSCAACHAPPKALAAASPRVQRDILKLLLEQRRREIEEEQRRAELDARMQALAAGGPAIEQQILLGLERRKSRQSRRTDKRGTVRFGGLAAGTYRVSLQGGAGLPVAVARGLGRRATLPRRGQAAVSFLLPRCGEVTLVCEREISPSTARVRLRAPESGYDVRRATIQLRDSDRRVVRLPPGFYHVDCDVPAGLPVIATLPGTIAVTSGRDVELPVRLVHVRGALAGRVIDSRGDGVSGVRVLATPPGHPGKRTTTGDEGKFEIRGLPSTALTVSVDPTRTRRGKTMYAVPDETTLSRPSTDVLLTIERGFELRVVVTDEKSGDKINGVPVRLTPGPRRTAVDAVARQGHAAFGHLRRGRYRVDVLGLDGHVVTTREVAVEALPASGRVEVTVTTGAGHVLAAGRAANLDGQ